MNLNLLVKNCNRASKSADLGTPVSDGIGTGIYLVTGESIVNFMGFSLTKYEFLLESFEPKLLSFPRSFLRMSYPKHSCISLGRGFSTHLGVFNKLSFRKLRILNI